MTKPNLVVFFPNWKIRTLFTLDLEKSLGFPLGTDFLWNQKICKSLKIVTIDHKMNFAPEILNLKKSLNSFIDIPATFLPTSSMLKHLPFIIPIYFLWTFILWIGCEIFRI